MREAFISKRFNSSSIQIIGQASDIIRDYMEKGYNLTLRQLYYQFVARGLLSNNIRSYKRLGGVINDARLAGHIDWRAISDRTRFSRANPHWENPEELLNQAVAQYAIDKWEGAKTYVEVWVEKDALISIVQSIASKWDTPCFSCRGYVSQTAMYDASKRFIRASEEGKRCALLHLGDHDPSGIDMTRDIRDRLDIFWADVFVDRIALNMDQVKEYNPPPNPAKTTDSRYERYISEYGYDSWELDALDPDILSNLIEKNIKQNMNKALFVSILSLR